MIAPRRSRSADCVSDLRLDRLRLGELPTELRASVQAHLEGCDACRERAAVLADDASAFAGAVPPRRVQPEPTPRRTRWPAIGGLAGLAAAAAVLLLVRPPGERLGVTAIETPEDTGEATRVKGGAHIGFVVRRGDRTFDARPGDALHPGDALRFVYTTREPADVAVLSVDGAGTVSVYFPPGERTVAVTAAEQAALEGSVILDDTLGHEVVLGVFCERSQRIEDLRHALARDPTAPRFPAGCSTVRVEFDKIEAPP